MLAVEVSEELIKRFTECVDGLEAEVDAGLHDHAEAIEELVRAANNLMSSLAEYENATRIKNPTEQERYRIAIATVGLTEAEILMNKALAKLEKP